MAADQDGLAYRLVASLTSEVAGRLAGSPAEAEARAWAVRAFKALGFTHVRVEPFQFTGWQRGVERAELVSPSRQDLVITALGGSIATSANGVVAPIVFLTSFDELLAAPRHAFDGRIVFIDDRIERRRDGEGYGRAVSMRTKGAVEAARRGAVALLVRSLGTDSGRFAHTGNLRYAARVRKIPAAAVAAEDADRIERLFGVGAEIVLRLTLRPRRVPNARSGNVVAEIVGRERPREIVLLGAHLDSWDLGTGALDDGAGVAIVIAAALRAAGADMKPRRTIRVVLFGAEELGVVGGSRYADNHARELHVVAMEADSGTGVAWRYSTNVGKAWLPFFDRVGATLEPLGIERGGNRAEGGSDIRPLGRMGVPIVSIGQDATTFFDYHHTANDTLDKIEPQALEQATETFARVAAACANR